MPGPGSLLSPAGSPVWLPSSFAQGTGQLEAVPGPLAPGVGSSGCCFLGLQPQQLFARLGAQGHTHLLHIWQSHAFLLCLLERVSGMGTKTVGPLPCYKGPEDPHMVARRGTPINWMRRLSAWATDGHPCWARESDTIETGGGV